MAKNRKLGKTTDQRLAMLKCQTTDLLLHGKIVTTGDYTLVETLEKNGYNAFKNSEYKVSGEATYE